MNARSRQTFTHVLLAGGSGQAWGQQAWMGEAGKSVHSQGRCELLDLWGHPAEPQSCSAFSCSSIPYSVSSLLICGEINACKVLEKPSNCPYLPPGDTWYWLSLWKWFTGLLKPGKDQMLWASWSHLPSLLSANTGGGNWEIIDRRSFFGVLTRRTKYRRIVSLGEKRFYYHLFLFRAVLFLSATSSGLDHYGTIFLMEPVNQWKNYHGWKLSMNVPVVVYQPEVGRLASAMGLC